MTEQKEQEIVDRIEKSVCKEDTQKVLQEPRNKWFRDANGFGTDSLMANAFGNSFVAWSTREQICRTIYDIAMMRKKDAQNGEA